MRLAGLVLQGSIHSARKVHRLICTPRSFGRSLNKLPAPHTLSGPDSKSNLNLCLNTSTFLHLNCSCETHPLGHCYTYSLPAFLLIRSWASNDISTNLKPLSLNRNQTSQTSEHTKNSISFFPGK